MTGYRVALSTPNSSTVFGDGVATSATAHTWVGLVPGARYMARVVAVNAAGESVPLFVPFRQATVASTVRAARVAAWPRPGAATIVWAARPRRAVHLFSGTWCGCPLRTRRSG